MKPLSAFHPRILPHLPGCTAPFADQVLVAAAIDFCRKSTVLRQNLYTFQTIVGETQYDLVAPTIQYEVQRVLSVNVNGKELSPGMAEIIRNDLPTGKAQPRGFYTDRTGSYLTLQLTPPPDGVYDVIVNASLRPSSTATQLDDDLYNLWIDPIVNDAIARAMMVPDQPFTNPAQAQVFQLQAARAATNSRIESNYGQLRGSMTVRPRPFA
jgi:hypothetical protein